ncbi:MAG: molybdate ABC transporter permease subunit [Planctomycetota bacterium]
MLADADWQALLLTFRLAAVTTLLLLLVCLPVAWWLGRGRSLTRQGIAALSALPLVLPPTVMGFYLLLLLGAHGPVAGLLGHGLAFTFTGIVIGSMLYSLPFVLQPLTNAFRAIDQDVLDAAASLGAGPFDRFCTIALPQAWPGLLSAAVLGFAHTVGEFGVVVMIGGSIPGETLVGSVQIFEYVESSRPEQAHALAAVLVAICLLLLLLVYGVEWWRGRRMAP